MVSSKLDQESDDDGLRKAKGNEITEYERKGVHRKRYIYAEYLNDR